MSQPIFEILEEKKEKSYSMLVITPLEQGYGITVGNALRPFHSSLLRHPAASGNYFGSYFIGFGAEFEIFYLQVERIGKYGKYDCLVMRAFCRVF